MRWLLCFALGLTCSCNEPTRHDSPRPAPSASASVTPPVASASTPTPAPTASAPSAKSRCPDAGAVTEAPVRFVYRQVLVASPGDPTGTSFALTFLGRSLALPRASEIYPSCSVEATDDATKFRFVCAKRKEPVCLLELADDALSLDCGSEHHRLGLPCGRRATVHVGRVAGSVSYH